MPGPKIIAGAASGDLARYNCEERIFSGTIGSSPGGGVSSEVQQAHSDRPNETLADLPKVVAEAGLSIHGVQGDQAERRNDDRFIADNEHHRRRLSDRSEPVNLVRHVGAIARGGELSVRAVRQMLGAIARVTQRRKKLRELEKGKAQIEADLSADEKRLDEWLPRSLWDPQAAAPILSTPPFSPADGSGAPAYPSREPPPAIDPSEPPALLENGSERSPGVAPRANPETPQILMKADHLEPSVAPAQVPSPVRSAAHPQDSEGCGGTQQKRAEWAFRQLYPDLVLPPGLGVANLTRQIGKKLASQEAREAATSDGGDPKWNTVDRMLKRLKLKQAVYGRDRAEPF
jgi:hypothetical protein